MDFTQRHGFAPEMPRRRWYDQIDQMSEAVQASKSLPPEIQILIARNLNHYIDNYRSLNRNHREGLSIGYPKVCGLYRASDKKRWYDPHAELHRAFTMMIAVPDRFLEQYAHRILEISKQVNPSYQPDFGYTSRIVANDIDTLIAKSAQLQMAEKEDGIRLVNRQSKSALNLPELRAPRTTLSKRRRAY